MTTVKLHECAPENAATPRRRHDARVDQFAWRRRGVASRQPLEHRRKLVDTCAYDGGPTDAQAHLGSGRETHAHHH